MSIDFSGIMLAALLLDGTADDEIISLLCESAKLNTDSVLKIRMTEDPCQAAAAIAKYFRNPGISFLPSDLLPSWTTGEIMDGLELEPLIKWFQKRPPIWLRAKPGCTGQVMTELIAGGLDATLHKTATDAICLREPGINLYTMESFRKGFFEVQDLSSQVIGMACAPESGQRWWDACAGAGGKSLQLAAIMGGRGAVVSSDMREYKLEDLKRRARRGGLHNIRCTAWDGKPQRKKKEESFDGVLVDAPCSCSGTWRRNPDARWTTWPDEILESSTLQLKLISNASQAVRRNGVLVYATCSIFRNENNLLVEKFLSANPEFELEPFLNPLNGDKTTGMLQIYPWDGDCDGSFTARFRRK
jgi:16S rRNA (cytosine967-C5)-methyltransferase